MKKIQKNEWDKKNGLEKFIFLSSLAVVLLLLVYLSVGAGRKKNAAYALSVQKDSQQIQSCGQSIRCIHFTLKNHSGNTAQDVLVAAFYVNNSNRKKLGTIRFPYAAKWSSQEAWFTLPDERISPQQVEVQIVSFRKP